MVLKYRLPKRGKWSPAKVEYSTLRDAQRAVQVIRDKSKKLVAADDAKIGILGFSAGGHLACMTATRWLKGDADAKDHVERLSSRPDFACLIYPVISFMAHGHGGSAGNLLGRGAGQDVRKRFSGEFNVTKETPPIFMVHANNDTGVKPANSFIFYQTLRKAGISAELHIVSHGKHGFFDGRGWGVPGKQELRFTRSGAMWPGWTLNWLIEEKLVTNIENWEWTKHRAAMKKLLD